MPESARATICLFRDGLNHVVVLLPSVVGNVDGDFASRCVSLVVAVEVVIEGAHLRRIGDEKRGMGK